MEYHALDSLKYSYLWNKYRPVVLKLMVDATNGPQQYQFLKHEFHDINPKEKGGHSFAIEISNGRPSKEVKASAVAKSLFAVLDRSTKASELTESATYGFVLDKQYMLHINLEKVEEVEEVEDASPEAVVTPDAEESSEVEVTPEAKESSKD
ncbi:MAG: hypothetical protein ABJF04_22820 [Reichenbachiella sp.]|uniref:hypothetical protein n=1 Tax=Reichenbachiella sp. TaxID=2184521 RepID=UPI003263F0E0